MRPLAYLVSREERIMPIMARAPPTRVVCLWPMRSVRIPATGEKAKVAPIVNEPTRAVKMFIV